MKNNEEKKNGKEIIANVFNKASDIGKKVADNVQKGTQVLAEKAKVSQHDYKMKKYNPLFSKEFKSKNFHLPNIIQIIDDATIRDLDVCQGAMGWRKKVNGTEILFLCDEAVKTSGISFIPTVTCDAIYYVDNFDRNKYIKTDCIFSKAHEERMAELKHIAFTLGAKKFTAEIVETEKVKETNTKTSSGKVNVKANFAVSEQNISAESNETLYLTNKVHQQNNVQVSGKVSSVFEGNDNPQYPTLKWFMHDDTIKGLIEMRCSQKNAIKSEELILEGRSSATMSKTTACNLDSILTAIHNSSKAKQTNSTGTTMEQQAAREHSSKLIYNIEF